MYSMGRRGGVVTENQIEQRAHDVTSSIDERSFVCDDVRPLSSVISIISTFSPTKKKMVETKNSN